MPITIKQIAELANVSRGTVDKVLNNRTGVKEETRQKVLQIARELNYQPNFLGKALVKSKEAVKIGIILTPEYNPFIQEILEGIQNAKDEYQPFGIEILLKMPVTLEPSEQLGMLRELERAAVSGIAVFPIDNPDILNMINALADKGITIITCNSRLKGTKDICFIGQDHYKGGRTVGGLLCKLLPDGGNVGIIISSYNLSCHQDRLSGFKDRIAQERLPIHIIDIQENQDRKETAFKITLEYCNQYPDLKGIYVTGGGIAGVGSALDIVNRTRKIFVICHDLVPDTRILLKNGTVDFALGQNPVQQGYLLVRLLFDYLIKGQEPVSAYQEIPISIATMDSI